MMKSLIDTMKVKHFDKSDKISTEINVQCYEFILKYLIIIMM